MAKFVRARVVAHMGIGNTPQEADDDMKAVANRDNAALQAGERNPDAAVAILYDQDPGGGPCRPAQIDLGEFLIDLDILLAAKGRKTDDD